MPPVTELSKAELHFLHLLMSSQKPFINRPVPLNRQPLTVQRGVGAERVAARPLKVLNSCSQQRHINSHVLFIRAGGCDGPDVSSVQPSSSLHMHRVAARAHTQP